jgi:hypothetical protein
MISILMCHRFSPNGALWCTTHSLSTICMCGHHLLTRQARLSMSRRLYVSCRTQRQIMTRTRLSFCARFTTSRVAFFSFMRRVNCTCSEFCFVVRLQWSPLWSSGQSSWLQIRRPGFIPGTTRFSGGGEQVWVWNGIHSASGVQLRSYLIEK